MLPLRQAAPSVFCCYLFCFQGILLEEEVDRRNVKSYVRKNRGGRGGSFVGCHLSLVYSYS